MIDSKGNVLAAGQAIRYIRGCTRVMARIEAVINDTNIYVRLPDGSMDILNQDRIITTRLCRA